MGFGVIGVVADVLLYIAGAGLTVWLVRRWQPGLSLRASLAYVALAAAFVGPGLFTTGYQVPVDIGYRVGPWAQTLPELPEVENGLLQDVALQMFPFRVMVRERWLDGTPPLWAHDLGTGQPLLGNAQTAPFSPHHLAALPVPALRGMTLAVAWQLLLSLLCMHALVARLAGFPGAGGPGAALAAVSFTFSTFSVAWLYYPMGATALWIPGVLLGLVTLAAGERRAFGGLVLSGTGAAFAGHPETLAHIAVLAAVVAAALWWQRPAVGRGAFVRRLAGAAAVSFCLASPFLLPILETLEESERMVILEEMEAAGTERPMPPTRYLAPGLVNPLAYGSPRDGDFAGPGNWSESMSLYGGLLPLVLALAGAWVFRGRLAWLLAGGVLVLAGAFGHGPVRWLLESLPVLENGAHSRLRLLWITAVAVGGGWALERLTRGEGATGDRRWALGVIASLGLSLGILVALTPPGGLEGVEAVFQDAWWIAALAALGVFVTAVGVAAVRGGPGLPRRLGWLAVALTLIDLGLVGVRYNPVVPEEMDMGTAGGEPPAVIAELERRAGGPPFRVLGEGYSLVPNLSGLYGLWQPRYNDPAAPGLASRFLAMRMEGEYRPGKTPVERPKSYDPAFQDYLGLRWMLTGPNRRLPPPWKPGPRLGGIALWENPAAMSLFFLPQTVELALDRSAAYRRALEIEDFAARAVALREVPGRQIGTVTVTGVSHNGFELVVDTDTGGLVASSVSWAPGWRVRDADGDSIPTEIVNGAFLGFEVPPGRRALSLRYVPRTWWPAWGLFVLGLVGWAIAGPGARAWRQGRRKSEGSDPA